MINNIPTFVKWAGGKKQLLEQFKQFFPKKIDRYFEPFVGGGAVAFYVIKNCNPKEVYLSDTNEELVNTYDVIKNNVEGLIKLLKAYKEKHSKEFYYGIRFKDISNLTEIERAARFIYLNKTCFNGLYRVNSKGRFNVPIGSYKNPLICPENDLREISNLLKNAKIEVKQFYEISKEVKRGDFVYFDPPYYPLKKGKNFTTYTKENFLEREQERLSEVFKQLNVKNSKVMLSNSDSDFIKRLYKDYTINTVKANRMINCNGADRGKINELVVTN